MLLNLLSAFRYSGRAMLLVWSAGRGLVIAIVGLTVLTGISPAAVAYIGARIVDSVLAAAEQVKAGGATQFDIVLGWVALEALVITLGAIVQSGLSFCQNILSQQLGHRVNVMILEKASTLELRHFENADLYDKLLRAQRDAASRPLSLTLRYADLGRNVISLASFGVLLFQFSPWAVVILLVAGLPPFIAELWFSRRAYWLFRERSPDLRMQSYLETVLARDDHVKETKLYRIGPLLLDRYRSIFQRVFRQQRALDLRHNAWGLALGLLGTVAFYCAYGWVAVSAVLGRITLGQMTMHLMLFRNGQGAVGSSLGAIRGVYDDNLYLSTLFEFLDIPVKPRLGTVKRGTDPSDGVRFENVRFDYGQAPPALEGIDLHVKPGQSLALVGENGSGKTTLIKLLTGLYSPTGGRILLDGVDLESWDEATLHSRIGVVFQDFARYQFTVGENIGAGDVASFDDEVRWKEAADRGLATRFVETLPQKFHTQLGKWFDEGRELSGGQWQKIALSRSFMRDSADIVVLDEPTSAMDAAAEAEIFEHFRSRMRDRIAILISHRFSTVRMADHIVVMEAGRIIERGSHEELMKAAGRYAQLFSLQARGYQ